MNRLSLILSAGLIFFGLNVLSQSNSNNWGIGGSVAVGKYDFNKDSVFIRGAGPNFTFSYYPFDSDYFGIGISFDPIYLKSYGLTKTIGTRFNTSIRILGRNNKIFPLGLNLKYGHQTLNVKEQLFGDNIHQHNSFYGEVLILIPTGDKGNIFLGWTHFSNEFNQGIELKVGIESVVDRVIPKRKKVEEILYYD
jgi:hypothetical protein